MWSPFWFWTKSDTVTHTYRSDRQCGNRERRVPRDGNYKEAQACHLVAVRGSNTRLGQGMSFFEFLCFTPSESSTLTSSRWRTSSRAHPISISSCSCEFLLLVVVLMQRPIRKKTKQWVNLWLKLPSDFSALSFWFTSFQSTSWWDVDAQKNEGLMTKAVEKFQN